MTKGEEMRPSASSSERTWCSSPSSTSFALRITFSAHSAPRTFSFA